MQPSLVVRLVGYAASLLIIFNGLYLIIYAVYPVIADGAHIAQNIANLKFDVRIAYQAYTAYILLILGIALPGRSRVIWLLCLINLSLILFSCFWLQYPPHLLFLVLLSIALLGLAYRFFNGQFYLSYSFVFIFAFVIFALLYGSLGSYLLRNEFHEIHNLSDALYFTVITYSTVGYGDIYPITQFARYFVVSMVAMGLIMFTSGITLIAYMLNAKLKHLLFNFNRGKISMTNHIVFLGYGILAKILIERYRKKDEKYLVIDQGANMDTERRILLENDQLMISPYPGHIDTLSRARLNEAKLVIINFDSDSDTIFAVMNIAEFLQKFNKKPKILARIYYEENIEKAKKVGADGVIAPHLLAAEEIQRLSI